MKFQNENCCTGNVTVDNCNELIYEYLTQPAILDNATDILKYLFKANSLLTEAQQLQLEDHQTNCAVITLASIFKKDTGKSRNVDFETIDQVLASRPLMSDKKATYYRSSQQRYEGIMELAGRQ